MTIVAALLLGLRPKAAAEFSFLLGLIKRVARSRRVVGFDVVELCPHEAHHASDFFAAKLTHRVLSEVFAARDR